MGRELDKFDRLMRSVVEYLRETWLDGKDRKRGPITGCSKEEITVVEARIGIAIPAALKSWYRVAGKVPPDLNDHDADFSLEDLVQAQDTAQYLTQMDDDGWQLSGSTLPFSQRIGEQILLVDCREEADDPPVFHFSGETPRPTQVDIAFSVFMRDMWLEWLDSHVAAKAYSREEAQLEANGYATWQERKQVRDTLLSELRAFREEFTIKVHLDDLHRNEITSPAEFQRRWLAVYETSSVREKLLSTGLRLPYDWITPPA